jgi:YggT family protein
MILVQIVDAVYRLLSIAILVRVFMSWIRPQGYSPLYNRFARFIFNITEPLLEPIRNLIPTSAMGLDFSPMIVILLLGIMRNILWRFLY